LISFSLVTRSRSESLLSGQCSHCMGALRLSASPLAPHVRLAGRRSPRTSTYCVHCTKAVTPLCRI
jgi:hypothetical protein